MASAQPKPATANPTNSTVEIVSDSLAMGVMFALVLTVLGRGIGFIRGILFCRLMTEQQLGQWSMVWSFIMLLAPLAVLGLPGCFCRFTEHYRHRGQMGSFVKRIAWLSGFSTLLLAAAILSMPEFFSWMVFRETTHVTITMSLGVALVFVTAMNFLTSLVESLRQVRLVTLMRFVLGVVFAAVSCGLMLAWEDCTAAATVGYGVACVVASVPALWFIWKHRESFNDEDASVGAWPMFARIAPFAIWFWWSNLFNNMFEVADRYMLIHWAPVEADIAQGFVGQYHSGRVVPLLLVSVAIMLAGVLMPYMSAAWEKDEKQKVFVQLNWTVKLVSLVFTVGGFVVLLLSPWLFNTILEGRYDDGLAVLPLTLVYCIWMSTYAVAQDYLWVIEKGKLSFLTITIGLTMNIVLNILLIPAYGLWGAVIATAIANAINLVLSLMFNHWNGCKTDYGIWLCAMVPLLLLLPLPLVALGLVILGIAGALTNFLLNEQEKSQLVAATFRALAKTGLKR